MTKVMSREELERLYEESAQRTMERGTLEVWSEMVSQATQREITLATFAQLKEYRPEVHVFNELLVEYPRKGQRPRDKFVPDNMVVLHHEPLHPGESYDIAEQPVGPFLVLDYPFGDSVRKDYSANRSNCEHHLKVLYYLQFQADSRVLSLYRHTGRKYVSVKPNERDRYAIPELEMEVALLDGWVRFWFRDELLPLSGELLQQRDEERRRADDEKRRADDAVAELARLRAELERTRRRSGNGK